MRSLLWMNGLLAFLLTGVAAGAYMYSTGPFLSELSPTVMQKIGEIQDIEHLRKLTQFLIRGNEQSIRNVNGILESGIQMFAVLALSCGALFAVNLFALLKHRRQVEGRPVGWLKWF